MTAAFERRLLTVVANESLGAYRLLKAKDSGPRPAAGQFAMLAAAARWGGGEDERPFLPRAFSYARWQDGQAHFLIEDVGPGTRRLCELQPGEGLWTLGPLGVGFAPPQDGRRPLLVGGGVGIAPIVVLRDALDERRWTPDSPSEQRNHNSRVEGFEPASPTVLLGFRDAAHAEGALLLSGAAVVATDDGSVGRRGLVTDLLAAELDRDEQAAVYACGPPQMLEAVRAICAARLVPAQLALESGMACGFGACFGCVVPTRSGYVRLCVDGPVLDAAELGQAGGSEGFVGIEPVGSAGESGAGDLLEGTRRAGEPGAGDPLEGARRAGESGAGGPLEGARRAGESGASEPLEAGGDCLNRELPRARARGTAR